MKYSSLLFLFFILATSFTACSHEEYIRINIESPEPEWGLPEFYPGDREYGYANGIKNNILFEASAFARFHESNHDFFGIDLLTFTKDGFQREKIYLNEIPCKNGKYIIQGKGKDLNDGYVGSSYSRSIDDGDAIGAFYYSDSTSFKYILIEKIDTISKVAEGKLFVSYKIKNEYLNRGHPEKVAFKDVVFKTKIIN